MGVQASIDIYFEKLSFSKVISDLSKEWSVNDFGKISYIDNDDFDWLSTSIDNKNKVLSILEKRFLSNKVVGLTLINDNSGGVFLFYPDNNLLSIIVNINRKKINSTNFTDFSFYIKDLHSTLKNEIILKIVCNDVF